jgi:transportin-3
MFFGFVHRFLQRAPVPLLNCPVLRSILECALMASTLDHRDANASVMKFFYDLVHCGRAGEVC